MNIIVEKAADEKVDQLGARSWPIWTCGVSEFDWHYDQKETCLILEGEVEVSFEGGKAEFKKGDLVVFPEGLSCRWKIRKSVKKHYKFG